MNYNILKTAIIIALLSFIIFACSDDNNGTGPHMISATSFEWQYDTGPYDNLYTAVVNSDQSIVTGGHATHSVTDSIGTYEMQSAFIAKLSSAGDTLWTQYIGDSSFYNSAKLITQDGDGYLVFYLLNQYMSSNLLGIQKLYEDGSLGWNKEIQLSATFHEFTGILKTDDDYLILYGRASYYRGPSLPHAIKMTYNGDISWNNMYELDENASIKSMTKSKSGGFVLALDYSTDSTDCALFEIANSGDSLNFISIDKGNNEYALDIVQSGNGYQFLMAAYSSLDDYIYLYEIDSALKPTSGAFGILPYNCWAYGEIIPGDGFVVGGRIYDLPRVGFAQKYNLDGSVDWYSEYSNANTDYEFHQVYHTQDNGTVLVGSLYDQNASNRDFYLLKLNGKGLIE